MAKITYADPIRQISGQLQKDGSVHRMKVYRDKKGNVLAKGKAEVFFVENPRDFKKKPQSGAELANFKLISQARDMAIAERANPERMAYWTQRFQAQLETPDQDAPIDKNTGKPKTYCRLDAFIRACIYRDLRATR